VDGTDGGESAAATDADAAEPGSSTAAVVGAGAPPLPSVTDYDGSAADNRDYTDTNTAQKLTQEDVAALKAEGKTGQAIIQVGRGKGGCRACVGNGRRDFCGAYVFVFGRLAAVLSRSLHLRVGVMN
jgi:hypothetical protein